MSSLDNRGDDFFAQGPMFSGLLALSFKGFTDADMILGLRFYYVALFSSERPPGSVFNIAIEWTMYF